MFFTPYFVDVPKIDGNLKWIFNDLPHLFENREGNWKQHLYGKSRLLKRGELIFHTGGICVSMGLFLLMMRDI